MENKKIDLNLTDILEVEILHIRVALGHFFSARGTTDPENLSQEVVLRLLKCIEEGKIADRSHLLAYARGIARNVLREARRERMKNHHPLDSDPDSLPQTKALVDPEKIVLLQEAMECLSESERSLVERYYGLKPSTGRRAQLAKELGISPNALRIVMSRLIARIRHAME